ncbi:tetratricopeptide repeat protein [Anaerobiospirillum sp. NML120448]|uniref:tetratricopeptide repeat protein n=1 Tax=Anaerobiospirillum sp. NML120448 TaxID=2932816 RepID=UPI001FF41D38|nr:tetratricopeptide repeat protein [Anaerobiospirillum sp. NML120448]MCK0513669.1 tetratricopeptide repeat protein [Anaerobiospirillum sp. NML120448]
MYLTQENFEQTLKSSMQKPLFCLFFDQDPSCDSAKTALTSAISDTNEYVSLVMCDLQDRMVQVFASQIQLRTVPTLVVIDQGMPAALLEGQDIITNLQDTLNQFIPSAGDLLMREALQAEASGDLSVAVAKASEAFNLDNSNLSYRFIYARMLIGVKNTKAAHELLDNLGREEKQSPEYQQLISALTLAEQAQNSPELLELQAKFEQDDSDENAVAYAIALADAGKKEEALNILFAKLKISLAKEEVKKTFMDILSTMDGDPNQSAFRRKLYTIMY